MNLVLAIKSTLIFNQPVFEKACRSKCLARLCQKYSKTLQICLPGLLPVLVHTDSIIMCTWRWDSHVANVEELLRRYPWPLMHFPSPAQLSWTTNILCVLYITEIWTHVFAFFIFTSTLQYTIRLHVLKKKPLF